MNQPNQIAGRGLRLLATLIDALLVPVFAIALMWVSGVLEDARDYANHPGLRILGLGLASYLLLNGWLLWRHGETVGKRLLGIQIVRQGSALPAPLWRLLLLRSPVFLVLPVIDELPIFTRHRKCLHDWVAGTQVVRRFARKD